jgi:chromate reductase, NAD(P)H dehydrogenase (quinone)
MHLLALSGSLRIGSSNTTLLEAAARLAPSNATVTLWNDLGALPHFNPDLESADATRLPAIVAEWRAAVGKADALLLSTPEYARGLPGSFKNALDWLVGSLDFPGKAVAILSPSARSVHARAQLRLVLTTMSARVIERPSSVIQLPGRDMTLMDILDNPEVSDSIRSAMSEIVDDVHRILNDPSVSIDAPHDPA